MPKGAASVEYQVCGEDSGITEEMLEFLVMPPENLKGAFHQLRAFLGDLSQEQFARKLGITVRTVARWESGQALSPRILSQMMSMARGVSAWDAAEWFKRELRAALKLGPDERLNEELAPETTEEHALIGEFLRRYRSKDPLLQPLVEQLRQRQSECPLR